ncbi:MAG TPA: TetR/AcrR family transcriptional regulator [Solirubrobacterales bacterium]
MGDRGKGKRRSPLTPEAIIGAAIRIADERGIDAVSIRGIAAEIDARPMSLYDHFPSKGELLSAMADEVVAEVLIDPPLPDHWRDALARISKGLYAMLVRHPWLVFVTSRHPRFGPNSEKQAAQFAEAMSELALDSAEMWILVGIVNDYVLGHSLRAVTIPKPEHLEDVIAEPAVKAIPELASLPDYLRTRASVDRFEAGLEAVLDGIESRVLDGAA